MTTNARTLKRPSFVCLIGGGDIMVETAQLLTNHAIPTMAVVAPRHANERQFSEPMELGDALRNAGVSCHVTDDIGTLDSWPAEDMTGSDKIAFCFGPAWIFPTHVRSLFEQGMFNLNLIPQPHYVGGAHYTWQVMNGDTSGGAVLQEITGRIDKGDIFLKSEFDIADATFPIDYFRQNLVAGRTFMAEVVDRIVQQRPFQVTPYKNFDKARLYLPRLFTDIHGIVDWQWSAEEIVRFCRAFDRPYGGATTWLDDRAVRLRDVDLAVGIDVPPMHPFAAGIVLRAEPDHILVAARDGFIRIATVVDEADDSIVAGIRDGARLVSERTALAAAVRTSAKLSAGGPSTDSQ